MLVEGGCFYQKNIALLLVFIISLLFSFVQAAETVADDKWIGADDYQFTVDADGNATIQKYNGSDETIIVSSVIDGYDVIGVGEKAFSNCNTLTSVCFAEDIQSIGDWAFDGCDSLILFVPMDSYAYEYAEAEGIPYQFIE